MTTLPWTSLRMTCLLAALMLPAATGIAANPSDGLPAWPQSLRDACETGCESTLKDTHEITFVSRVAFPVGSAFLTGDAKSEMLRMLAELESYAIVSRIAVIGHADPSGPENFNIWLSGKRAERVAEFFQQSGVDPRMLSHSGRGSAEPLAGAIDPAEHRRTEVRITVRPFL